MFRIDTATAVGVEPVPAAPGTPGFFTDGNLGGGILPTVVSADWLNSIQDELENVVTAAGIALNKPTHTQLLTAIETLIEARAGNYAVDTGAANAYVVAISPTPDGTQNFSFAFRATHANTTACTVNFGFGLVPLDRDDGTAMQSGDIATNSIVMGAYDHVLNKALVQGIVLSQLGALAKLNIGAGLYNDGAGNLAAAGGTGTYVNTSQAIVAANYLVDTSGGPVALTLPAAPVSGQGASFNDATGSWGLNAFTLNGNGKNIGNAWRQVASVTAGASDIGFNIWFNGTYWEFV